MGVSNLQHGLSFFLMWVKDDFTELFHLLGQSVTRLYGSSGCFGCCSKSMPVIAVDEPSKGLRIQGRAVTKSSLSDEFWSTTTCDVDHAAIHSQKSISSISGGGGGGSTSIQPEYVNRGLLQWNQSRLQWVDHKKSKNSAKPQEHILRNTTYESLLGTAENFPHSIPLSEMVGFLVNIWEQEGLYE